MTREEILEQARICVCGEREQDYGSPEDNFAAIADLWSTYLTNSCMVSGIVRSQDAPFVVCHVTSKDVACMMALLKIARIATGTGTADSFVDLAGYAACGGEIATRGRDAAV